jgi:signal transduction histidine kinase
MQAPRFSSVKKLSRRIARVAPSITVALILFTVGLTALLAFRAFEASRAQRRVTEQTLRDYAGFAAFQLTNATIARFINQHRQAVDSVVQWVNTRGTTPPLDARRLAGLVEPRGPRSPFLGGISFYYRVTFPDSAIESSASAMASPENLRQVRDTVIAQAMAMVRRLPPPGPEAAARPRGPVNVQFFAVIFSRLGGRPYMFAHALTMDRLNAPLSAYGYAVPAEQFVGDALRFVLASQPVLPRTLTRGLTADSILAVRVTDASRQLVYASSADLDVRYAATDSLDSRMGGLYFEVAISPAAAGHLIIGGLPRSRLPEVLATAFVAMSLLGLLLFQFRRQEELGRLRDDFVSGVSHELRTPLAQIRLLAELLRMGKVPTEEHKDRSLRIIDQEARRLSFLVDSILNFSRSQDGKLSPVKTDVAAEIEEIVEAFKPLAHAHSAQLAMRLEPELVADVDRDALRQVLINLLDNAVRYGPSGQTVKITTASSAGTWTVEVADEGPGVPADERERIFAPYYRMERDAGGAVGGTGIGLAVVRRLVTQHGGQVRVASANGDAMHGARFLVTLPIR